MFPANFIVLERILCQVPAGSKKRALETVGELLAGTTRTLTETKVFQSLLERERLGSTGLGRGVALPHARVKGAVDACGAFIQLKQGIDFDAVDGEPVDLVFGLLVPEDARQEHLQLLATLATLFSDNGFCSNLRDVRSPEKAYQLLLSRERAAPAE